ncbi:MAG: L,D-transpeptidase [Propionibacteriaceae bacterium]|nr:L,D-transpeptidase [Propionibacteriaceae bacterium]
MACWAVLGVTLGLAMDAAYSGKALPGFTLAGTDVGGMSRAQVQSVIVKDQADIAVEVTIGQTTKTANASQLGIAVDAASTLASVTNLSDQRMWIYRDHAAAIPLTLTIDKSRAQSWASENFPDVFSAPVNADLSFDATATEFTVVPAKTGTTISDEDIQTLVDTVSAHHGKVAVTWTPHTEQAKVQDAQAATTQQWANERLATPVTLTWQGETMYTLTAADIASITSFSPSADGALTPTFDASNAHRLIRDVIAPALDQAPVAQKDLTDDTGAVVSTTQQGVPGRSLTATDALATSIATGLTDGGATSVELSFTTIPFQTEQARSEHPAPPAGSESSHWADVNLTNQTVTLMAGSNPSSTFTMSSGAPSHPTPTGTWDVYAKVTSQSLSGCVEDECYDYDNVAWATWFYQDYGFHTAYWHNDFGTPVSHGCLNLREADAKAVFDWLSIGDAVAIHN